MHAYTWFTVGAASCLTIFLLQLTGKALWPSNLALSNKELKDSLRSYILFFLAGSLLGGITAVFASTYLIMFLITVFGSDRRTKADFTMGAVGVCVLIAFSILVGRETIGCICKDGTQIYGNHPKPCLWYGGVDHWLYKYWWE